MEGLKKLIEARARFKSALIERVIARHLGDDVVDEIKARKEFTPVAQGMMAMNQVEFKHCYRYDGAEWLDVLMAGNVIETVHLEAPFEGFAP